MVVLLPKGGGNYQGIGILEPFCKTIEVLINSRLQVIQFHDCLHGFLKECAKGTATIEAKLAQQLAYLEQEALHTTFIDLHKAYDAMDRERCLKLLKGYGVGTMTLRLIKHFWDVAMLVYGAVGNYGGQFKA